LNSLLSSAENQPIITAQQTDHSDKSAADIPTINSVPQLLQFKLALLHNDFRDDHVYIDRRTGNVTGIIDFGNVALGDPFDDFVLLLLRMGEDFVEQLLAFYHTKEPAVLRAQLKHRDQLFG
jgi:Ser/Thr protein kinase RdoA (MazF antagonist)